MSNHPVYEIPCSTFAGKLYLMPYPKSAETVQQVREDYSIETLLCLLPTEEQEKLSVANEADWCLQSNVNYLHFPVNDYDVPKSIVETKTVVQRLLEDLNDGKNVAIHCRAGIGRSSLICAVLLTMTGLSLPESLEQISVARGVSVPETNSQKKWLEKV